MALVWARSSDWFIERMKPMRHSVTLKVKST